MNTATQQNNSFEFTVDDKKYLIPWEKCDINLYRTIGNVLMLETTGEYIVFRTIEAAQAAWCYLADAFKHHATYLIMDQSWLGFEFDCYEE